MDRVREIVISRKEVLDLFVWWYNTNDNLLYKYENGWELVIGKASQTQDGLMSKEDKILLDTYTGVASATTIAGYGITDAYTKTEVDTFIDNLGAASMIEESVESYETFDDFPLPAYAKEDTIYIDLTTNLIYYWAEDSLEYVLITNKDNVIYISNPNDILEIPNLDSEVTEGLYKVKHVKGTEVLNYTLNIKRAGTTITQVLQSFEFYATRKKYASWLVWEKFEYAYTQNLVEFSIPPATSETKINLGIKDNKYYRYKFTVNNLNLVYTGDICKQGSVIEFTTSADFTPDKFSWTNGFTDSTQTVPLFTDLYGEPIGPNTKVIIFYQRNVMLIRLKRITSVVDIDGHLGINRTTGATTTFLNLKGGFSEIIIPVFGTTAGTVSEGNHTHTFASLTSKPTNLTGYGITDAYTKIEIDTKLNNTRTYKILNTPVSTWLNSTTHTKYPCEAVIPIDNLKESDSVEVIYNIMDASSGNYAPGGELYEGHIKIFAKVNTEITIPTLVITKIDL